MILSSQLYHDGYIDACRGQRMDHNCDRSPAYLEGYADGTADSSRPIPEILLPAEQAAAIRSRRQAAGGAI